MVPPASYFDQSLDFMAYSLNIGNSFAQAIANSGVKRVVFITRKITNHKILDKLENVLTTWFNNDALAKKGLPAVHDVAAALNVSPGYLSGLLKMLTGQSTQQHIHDKLIERRRKGYQPPASRSAKLLMSWVLNIRNHSASCLKPKPACRRSSSGILLIDNGPAFPVLRTLYNG
jgi:AraC-like DNA-binding protein